MARWFIVASIGNTSTEIARFFNGKPEEKKRIPTISIKDPGSLSRILGPMVKSVPSRFIVSSVVPELDPVWTETGKRLSGTPPIFVSSHLRTGITIDYQPKDNLGADRIANAVAALKKYQTSAIIVDIGTAINIDCITASGRFLGGAIAPGMTMALNALHEYTSKLPRIDLSGFSGSALGKDTRSCIQAGIAIGFAGLCERLVHELIPYLPAPVTVVATGGGATAILPYMKSIGDYDPDLTLIGTYLIGKENL